MATHNTLHTILALSSALMLGACASKTVSSNGIPEGGLTVSQIYQQSINEPVERWSVKLAPKHCIIIVNLRTVIWGNDTFKQLD